MSQILAWICLVLVTSLSAYGLQLTAAALTPSAATYHGVISAASTRAELLVAVDPATGDDKWQVECQAPADTFASDVVMVDPSDFPAMAHVCIAPTGR